MRKKYNINFETAIFLCTAIIFTFTLLGGSWRSAFAQDIPDDNPSGTSTDIPADIPAMDQTEDTTIEIASPYLTIIHTTLEDGTQEEGYVINGPSHPLEEFAEEYAASTIGGTVDGTLPSFPAFTWVFGCSAVSAAMIAAYYDRGSYPNMYSGATNGGVMPLTDASWTTWSDGDETYPNNPLIASHKDVDGRTIRGSIDDYWVKYDSPTADPYITGGWTQHTWGSAIGDYMKTSQSAYENTDGSTVFWNYVSNSGPYSCTNLIANGHSEDGTVGRKLFYEARGYTVTDCYNQKTDNNGGGFALANFQAEINAGNPVLLNLSGHSVVGYGYSGSTIYIRDTWDTNTHTMTWGGSYESMGLRSVSIVHLAAPAPTPGEKTYLPLVLRSAGSPTDIGLSNASIMENQSVNTVIGSLTTTSAAVGDSFTYSLVSGTGSTDNGSFNISGNNLRSSIVFDYEAKKSFTIRIRSTGQNGFIEKAFTITILDVNEGTGSLINGNFESQSLGWTESSSGGYDLIVNDFETNAVTPHGGSWAAWLGGADNETSILSQTVTVPSATPYLHFWYWIGSEDICNWDYFYIRMNDANVHTRTLCEDNNTNGWVQGVVNLSAYAGTSNILRFRVTTDTVNNSNLFLDDIFFSSSPTASNEFFGTQGIDSMPK
ncbi:MAG: hypothetical protein WA116_05080 [Anaerolineaceae bacterium]